MKTITVTVSPTGEAVVEAHGYSGPDCTKATAPIESALGPQTGRRLKPEFHAVSAPAAAGRHNHATGGR